MDNFITKKDLQSAVLIISIAFFALLILLFFYIGLTKGIPALTNVINVYTADYYYYD